MIVSAQDLTRTRLCQAERCEQDAEHNSHLCWRCLRLPEVRLHAPPEVYNGPTLPCCVCKQFKPDTDFPKQTAGKAASRRYRNNECKACSAARRRVKRTDPIVSQREAQIKRNYLNRKGAPTPEQRARKNELARIRYAKKRP